MPAQSSSSQRQDELVRELTEIQKNDQTEVPRERRYLNLGLFIMTLIFGSMLFYANYKVGGVLPWMLGLVLIMTLASTAFGSLGLRSSGIAIAMIYTFFFLLSIFLLYYVKTGVREMYVLAYSIFIIAITTQLKLNGYIASLIFVIITEAYITFSFGIDLTKLHSSILTILLSSLLGCIPLLAHRITKIRRETRLQQLRLEILALQNQDLVNSWQEYFTRKSQ